MSLSMNGRHRGPWIPPTPPESAQIRMRHAKIARHASGHVLTAEEPLPTELREDRRSHPDHMTSSALVIVLPAPCCR